MFATPTKCVPTVTFTSLLVHTLGALWYTACVYYDRFVRIPPPVFLVYGGRSQYLTMNTLYLTFAASVYAFCVDLIQYTTHKLHPHCVATTNGYARNTSLLLRIRDELMSCWVYSSCTIVPIMYWGIVYFHKDGIHSQEVEKRMPLFGLWNQCVHTIPFLYAFLLLVFVNYEHIAVRRMLLNSSLFTLGYVSWMGYCAQQNGYWAYPVIQKQNNVQFAVFLVLNVVVLMSLQAVGRKVAAIVWSEKRCKNIVAQIESKER